MQKLTCEAKINFTWEVAGDQKTCYVTELTTINAAGFKFIGMHYSVGGLSFYGNREVSFLPVDIDQNFPNLLAYNAASCSISLLSKSSFKGLHKVRELWLNNNYIVRIDSDTFEDLVALKCLVLS